MAIEKLVRFSVRGDRAEDVFFANERTRWSRVETQTWELEAELDGKVYVFRLVTDLWGEQRRPRVLEETVRCDGKPVFEFLKSEVHLFNDRFEHKVTYPFDWHRSALATIQKRNDNQVLSRFIAWLSEVRCFQLNPFVPNMGHRTEGEALAPRRDLSDFASWYRHLVQAFPRENSEFLQDLQTALAGFGYLQFESAGENVRMLMADFGQRGEDSRKFNFSELSDGQRCLICLYAIVRFLLANGATVFLDEPDNFVALREIQPWLMAANDVLDEDRGQLLIVSHHPELVNQWAPDAGLRFFREGGGPVRCAPFVGDPEGPLTPAELVARGWEGE